MKILFVAHSGKISGGANRSLLSIICELKKEYGIEASVLVPESNSALEEYCRNCGVSVIVGSYHSCCTVLKHKPKDVIRILKIISAPVLDRINAYKIVKKISESYDLVYTNDRMITVGGYISRILKIPHIWHIRSFAKENNTQYAPGYLHIVDKYADKIVVISGALYQSLVNDISESKLELIHNGISIEQYSIREKEKHKEFNILLTGRIVPSKGQMEAVKALHSILLKNRSDVHLYFAGEIPTYESKDYYQKICRAIEYYGMVNNVHFLGEMDDISTVRKKMDVEIVCSWCEAFGRVTIEAMSARIPVIAANSGGTKDIIKNGKNGLLYEVGNFEDLASKICWVSENQEEAERMTDAGYESVCNYFSIEHTVKKINDLLNQVVKQ